MRAVGAGRCSLPPPLLLTSQPNGRPSLSLRPLRHRRRRSRRRLRPPGRLRRRRRGMHLLVGSAARLLATRVGRARRWRDARRRVTLARARARSTAATSSASSARRWALACLAVSALSTDVMSTLDSGAVLTRARSAAACTSSSTAPPPAARAFHAPGHGASGRRRALLPPSMTSRPMAGAPRNTRRSGRASVSALAVCGTRRHPAAAREACPR